MAIALWLVYIHPTRGSVVQKQFGPDFIQVKEQLGSGVRFPTDVITITFAGIYYVCGDVKNVIVITSDKCNDTMNNDHCGCCLFVCLYTYWYYWLWVHLLILLTMGAKSSCWLSICGLLRLWTLLHWRVLQSCWGWHCHWGTPWQW